MKLPVSLPDDDVRFLGQYAKEQGYDSRSAVLHKAVSLLKVRELGKDTEAAFKERDESEDARLWDQTSGDGL